MGRLGMNLKNEEFVPFFRWPPVAWPAFLPIKGMQTRTLFAQMPPPPWCILIP